MSKGKPEPAAGHCHLGQKAVGLPGQLLCLQGKAAVPHPRASEKQPRQCSSPSERASPKGRQLRGLRQPALACLHVQYGTGTCLGEHTPCTFPQ